MQFSATPLCTTFALSLDMLLMNCPTCQKPIESERIIQNKAYCSCGQVVDLISEHHTKSDIILLRRLFLMVIAGVLIAAHLIIWRGHAFEIIPLKIKQVLGVASPSDLKSIAAICDDQQKWGCEIQALAQLFAMDHHNLSYLSHLAKIQADHGQLSQARQNYDIYFRLGGRSDSVRLQYANVLAKLGDKIQAKREFAFLVYHRHRKPQFEVAREYVHFLMKYHDYPTARAVIRRYRSYGTVASMFMNRDWVKINDQVRASRTPASMN